MVSSLQCCLNFTGCLKVCTAQQAAHWVADSCTHLQLVSNVCVSAATQVLAAFGARLNRDVQP